MTLTPDETEAAETTTVNAAELARRGRNWQRLQAVLLDRFKLVLRLETHELPVYALLADEKGIKLSRSADGKPSSFLGPAARLSATAQPIGRLTTFLSAELGRPVIDETRLDGNMISNWSGTQRIRYPRPLQMPRVIHWQACQSSRRSGSSSGCGCLRKKDLCGYS